MEQFIPWLKFAFCALVIGFAGPRLTRYADVIARHTGLSRSWIGLVLLATATSLPELFTGLSAVIAAAAPDIAVGNALGSCVFNLAMLILLDELSRDEPMYRRVDQGHLLTAGFGIIMIGSAGAFLLLSRSPLNLQIFHISAYTPLLIVLYVVAMRGAFVYERRVRRPPEVMQAADDVSLRTALIRYFAAAAVVVAAGSWLPFIGAEIAELMGWNTTFVGTLLISAATTLPELVVTISALRMGAVDMAIGNLLGSNVFNILILAIDDLAYVSGPLLSAASPANAITAFAAMVMSGIFIAAMLYKPESRIRGTIGWVSIALLFVYMFSAYAIFLHGQ